MRVTELPNIPDQFSHLTSDRFCMGSLS